MKSSIIIPIIIIVSIIVTWAIFSLEPSDSEELQNTIDDCTNAINNMGPSDSDLESCLDDAYNQYGSEEEKQSWFDDGH